ncbi:MAG TPA: DUF6580 family putative transport protein, partial [Hymenobacter sp.]|nr:DUF6580 family putative transport protein [Hymenobacter sp.]
MATPKVHLRSAFLLLLILLTACFRLLNTEATHSPLINFTPVGAMALFSGCYFRSRWQAYLLPLAALWCSDVLLNRL